jgi:hypothetical protein
MIGQEFALIILALVKLVPGQVFQKPLIDRHVGRHDGGLPAISISYPAFY